MGNNKLLVLKRSSDFQKIKNSGKKVWACRWLLLSYAPSEKSSPRFGWTVSKKVGSAVVRNRLKRWCREYFRTLDFDKERQLPLDVNVVFIGQKKNLQNSEKNFYKELKFSEFQKNISKAWQRIERENNGIHHPRKNNATTAE